MKSLEKESTNSVTLGKKDTILREKLALQRTEMSSQRTFLSYLRTSMYFLVAGLSLKSLLKLPSYHIIQVSMYSISFVLVIAGIIAFYRQGRRMKKDAEKWMWKSDGTTS